MNGYYELAIQGDKEAQYKLGYIYFNGKGVEQNVKQGLYWLKKAANQNHIKSQCVLGTYYRYINISYNIKYNEHQKDIFQRKEFHWFKKSSIGGYNKSFYLLAKCYQHGEGIKEDFKQAIYW
jgi:TPR repeat protein